MKLDIIIFALLLVTLKSLTCEQGYVENSLSICIQPRYIEGCSQYNSQTTCKVCEYRYSLQPNGLCNLDGQCADGCCVNKAIDGTCTKCQNGLYLIGGKCQQSNIIGCLQKDSQGICINCASNFYLKDGVCEKSIKNCVKFSDDIHSVCTSCASGYSLYDNFCVANSILGCKDEYEHFCKQCYKPFVLSHGNCQISHCKAYNDYKCVACQCGFYLTSEGVCKAMSVGCVRYQRGQCTDCLPNFRLKGNQCVIEGCEVMKGGRCSKCSAEYDLVEGGCNMKNCYSWKDGVCQICKQGYNLKNGSCVTNQSLVSQ